MNKGFKKLARYIWIGSIITAIALFAAYQDQFSTESLIAFINQYRSYGVLLLFVLHISRAFVLLPATPLVIAAVILYPDWPFIVLLASMLGVFLSSSLIYFLAKQLEFGQTLGAGKPAYRRIRRALSSRYGYWYILFWSFMPGAPTDLVCLLAGAMRLSFPRFILAVLVGQGIIYAVYVYGTAMFLT